MNKKIQSLLRELEKDRKKYWNIDAQTGQFLNQLIKDRRYKQVLEYGTSTGYSAIWLLEALSSTGGILTTMESHKKERYHLAKKNIQRSGLSKYANLILGHAPEDTPSAPELFDLAFFDATKHEHLNYFKVVSKRIKRGGMIITDNIVSHKDELAPYIKHAQSQKSWTSEVLNIGTGLLVSTKIK
jgi:predicted O-methyltransferase YrrM